MDKSFNDQELSDIMKEIEALEDDFTTGEEKTASPIMDELAQMDEVDSVPVTATKEETFTAPNIVSLESKRADPEYAPTKGASTSMSFKVQGNLALELQFDIGGKVVSLEVTETGLAIEMEGGARFSLPLTESSSVKKAV